MLIFEGTILVGSTIYGKKFKFYVDSLLKLWLRPSGMTGFRLTVPAIDFDLLPKG